MKLSRWTTLAAVGLLLTAFAATAALGSGRAPAANRSTPKIALVSDIGRFTDRSFNQFQLEGLNRAKAKLGVNTIPLQSNSTGTSCSRGYAW